MELKKGDTVELISGKDRGKRGKVLQVITREDRIVVEGLNLMVKNVRPRRGREHGQLVKFNAPVHISNTQLICPKCGKRTRVGHQVVDSKKARACLKCRAVLG